MKMSDLLTIVEAGELKKSSPMIDAALWWVSRWISGSMDDPDWEWPEGEALGVDKAFEIVQQTIGNAKSIGRPLYRYIAVSEHAARKIARTKLLHPHDHRFQSFTTSPALAKAIGEDLVRPGAVHIIVGADVPPQDVMFGLADLKASRLSSRTILEIGDWHHQDEVVVRVSKPLPLVSVTRVKFS